MDIIGNDIPDCVCYNSCEKVIYFKSYCGFTNFFVYYPKEKKKELWIEDGFVFCRLIDQSGIWQNIEYCYVLLKDVNDRGLIMEIVSKKIIIQDLDWDNNYFVISKNLNEDTNNSLYLMFEDNNHQGYIIEVFSKKIILDGFEYSDFRDISQNRFYAYRPILSFLNRRNKTYSLFSATEGYIFGPYNYKMIMEHRYGVTLDGKTLVENDGTIIDLSCFEVVPYQKRVFKHKSKKQYLFLLEDDGRDFVYMDQDEKRSNIWRASSEKQRYIFDEYSNKLNLESIIDEEPNTWTSEERDYAFEGYSELELGID